MGLPGSASGKETTCQCRRLKRHKFNPWVGKIPWRRAWQLTPVFLGFPGDSAGKNLPAIQDTWVQTLGQEDPLEKWMATKSSVLAWRIPMDRGAWWAPVQRVAKSQIWWSNLSLDLLNCLTVVVLLISVTQSRPILLLPHGLWPPDSSVHGISQAGLLGWVAIYDGLQNKKHTSFCNMFWFVV